MRPLICSCQESVNNMQILGFRSSAERDSLVPVPPPTSSSNASRSLLRGKNAPAMTGGPYAHWGSECNGEWLSKNSSG
jgi:hypothetical protein